MKTIQIKKSVWILGLLLSVSNLSSQKTITNHPSANGYPVIDLTELSPLNCILTTADAASRRKQINEQTPSSSAFMAVGESVSGVNGIWNTKMSSQYQVMRVDCTAEDTGWVNAYTLCKQYNNEGGTTGQWRLPTQRELMMIWDLHPQLLKETGAAFNTVAYWSSTEDTATTAWLVYFSNGHVSVRDKTRLARVRCVRDL